MNHIAQAVIDNHNLTQEDGERPLSALGWALGEEIEYEAGMTVLVEEAFRADEKHAREEVRDWLAHLGDPDSKHDYERYQAIVAIAGHFGIELKRWEEA